MKRLAFGCLLLMGVGATSNKAFAVGSDFTKDEIAAFGKHCVHGFWVNQQTVLFFAGDAAQLNRDLLKHLEGEYASRKIVIHPGTKRAESPWDTKARDTFADWAVNTWDDPADAAKAVPRMRMQIDIWLGDRIRIKDLRIPKEFEVVLRANQENGKDAGVKKEPPAAKQPAQRDAAWDLSPPAKEPKYVKEPRYALLAFGVKREQRVWMVLDGTTLYVDRNGNGDLTEPGERLEPLPLRISARGPTYAGPGSHTHFDIFEFTVQAGATGTSKFQLHHWIRAETFTPETDFDKLWHAKWLKLRWESSTLWRKEGQGQGQTPLLFMPKPADAQVCALDAPPTIVVRLPDHQVLKRGAADNDVAFCIAVNGRPPRGVERAFHNPLTTREVPETAHLEVEIEYPAKTANSEPLRRKHLLKERC
jgi:hypothetical protein